MRKYNQQRYKNGDRKAPLGASNKRNFKNIKEEMLWKEE